MTAQALWEKYCGLTGINAPYEAWQYGGVPDELAMLTAAGIKTATASAYELYDSEGERMPQAGEYSVVLDSDDQAVCIIRNIEVTVVPFLEVTDLHAWREGEGDRSLAYWREVHERFFREEYAALGKNFTDSIPVVCEHFELCFTAEQGNV